MKSLCAILIFTFLVTTSIAHAAGFDPKKANAMMRSISPWILSIEGASGISLITCPSQADPSEIERPSAYCIAVNTETEGAYLNLLKILPPGSNRGGVLIVIQRPEVHGCGG